MNAAAAGLRKAGSLSRCQCGAGLLVLSVWPQNVGTFCITCIGTWQVSKVLSGLQAVRAMCRSLVMRTCTNLILALQTQKD